MASPTRLDFRSICFDLPSLFHTYIYTVKVFNFFRTTKHHLVRICNKTAEVCVGEGSLCNGYQDDYRNRRSVEDAR